jgi:hypothetical protein
MKLSKRYFMKPDDAQRVRMKMGKGCCVLGCLIPIGIISALFLSGFFPEGGRWIVYAPIILLIMLVYHLYLQQAAMMRLQIGRDYAQKDEHESVIAALEPFAYPGTRLFDKSGEANYLLGNSAKEVGEKDFASYCLRYASTKQSEWAEKAKKLIP